MKSQEIVSIIMATYNVAQYIEDSIRSVQAQTYMSWELLITDDCSSDNTLEIVKKLSENDSRIKVWQLQKNSGAGIARNNSIKEASGRYIAFLDSDDMWMPTKLEKQIRFMKDRDCALSYTSYLTCNYKGKVKGIVVPPRKQTLLDSLCDNKIGFSTVIYDLQKLGKIYLPDIRKRQDWGMLMRVLSRCKLAYGMKEPLSYYRVGQNSLSKKKSHLIKYQIAVYRKVLHWGKMRAALWVFFVFTPCYIIKKLELRYINR